MLKILNIQNSKLNIQKTNIMASGPITSWQIDGETMETVTDFIFLGFKITTGGDFSLKIKTCLFCGRKSSTNLDSILKSRDITLPKKIQQSLTTLCQQSRVKAMVFPLAVYGSESWTIKKWESRNWCFWTVMLEKTLESPLDSKQVNAKGNQPWIFIERTDAGAETPIL